MIKYLTGIKSSDGLPLFTRCFPPSNQLPFALLGTLNGIFTFGDGHGVKLISADTENFKILWKMYHSNITLILIENQLATDDTIYFDKIDLLFDAIVLLHGLDDLINIKNIEKFKREIRISFPLLDSILDANKVELFGDITKCVDMFMTNDKNVFQNALDTITPIVNTHFSCLMVNGKIVVASKSWWELKPSEIFLISLLCMTSISATCRDIPIYLPHKNPHTPLRLLTYNLSSDDIVLCFICSQTPAIDAVEEDIIRVWQPVYKLLINTKLQKPRSIPTSIDLDSNILAFLLINKKKCHVVSSLDPNSKNMSAVVDQNMELRSQILKVFYQTIMSNYFTDTKSSVKELLQSTTSETSKYINDENECRDAYLIIGNYKCYALNRTFYELYVIYDENIPTYAVRGVTQECLNLLTKDNLI